MIASQAEIASCKKYNNYCFITEFKEKKEEEKTNSYTTMILVVYAQNTEILFGKLDDNNPQFTILCVV